MPDVAEYIARHHWVGVTLTADELAYTECIGQARYARCRELGLPPRTWGKEALADPALNDRRGAGAEFAAGTYLGARWTGLLDGPDDGSDLTRFRQTFDVKSAAPQGMLRSNGGPDTVKADWLVLVYAMTPAIFAIVGGIARPRFLAKATLVNLGYGDHLALPWEWLDPPEYLLLATR